MKPYKIAFGYKARAGKDFAASYLISKHGGQVAKLAEPVYKLAEMLQSAVGFPIEKDRELLQYIGTDWGRKHDPNVWVRMFGHNYGDPGQHTFVTDMRFRNEADALREYGYVLVRVDRSDLPEPMAAWRRHQSEIDLDGYEGWHYIVQNCGQHCFHTVLDILIDHVRTKEHEKHYFKTLTIR